MALTVKQESTPVHLNIKQLREDHRALEKSYKVLAKQYDELVKRYPDQWIALHYSMRLAYAGTLDELRQRMEQLELSPNQLAIEFLETEPRTWIL